MKADKPILLVFSDWYFPGYKAGGPIQSTTNLVRFLADQYNFYVLCSDRDLGETAPYPSVQLNEWNTGEAGEMVWYAPAEQLTARFIREMLNKLQPQAVYFNSMFSVRLTLLPLYVLSKLAAKPLIVLAPRGMLQAGALQLRATKKKIFLQAFRWLGWHKFIRFQATDQQELQDIATHFPGAMAVLAENIPHRLQQQFPAATKVPGKLKLVFISRIHPKKNLHFLLELLAGWTNPASLQLDIYGDADEPSYLHQCKAIMEKLPANRIVEFKGPVDNKEVFAVLSNYHAFVLPSLGENFGHAIFEALESGKPVLISNRTPWQQLSEQKAGWDIPLDQKDRYWNALDQLAAMDQSVYTEWSEAARQLASAYIRNAGFREKYSTLFA
jgi:glycosyltransferase involved in cell wall biosynthesis